MPPRRALKPGRVRFGKRLRREHGPLLTPTRYAQLVAMSKTIGEYRLAGAAKARGLVLSDGARKPGDHHG
jgi:hypothetical protein